MTISHRVTIAILALFAAVAVTIGAAWIGYTTARASDYTLVAQADTGSATPTAPDGSAAPSPTPSVASAAPDDLARAIYRGVTKKDWFLVAGGVLMFVVMGARWLLTKKWPSMKESDIKGVLITAALAGFGALATAWLADERVASSVTLLGAVKVWAAAVFAYVTSKKLLAARKPA